MPSSKSHRIAGGIVGGGSALIMARDQKPVHQSIEAFSGVLAGLYFGVLPDLIEPAKHPNHRKTAHSLALGLVIIICLGPMAKYLAGKSRELADWAIEKRQTEESLLVKTILWFLEIFLRFAAGALNAISFSYSSHLILDAFTPKSLPLY